MIDMSLFDSCSVQCLPLSCFIQALRSPRSHITPPCFTNFHYSSFVFRRSDPTLNSLSAVPALGSKKLRSEVKCNDRIPEQSGQGKKRDEP